MLHIQTNAIANETLQGFPRDCVRLVMNASNPGILVGRSAQSQVAMSADGRRTLVIAGGVASLDGAHLADGAIAGALVDGAVWLVRDGEVARWDLSGTAIGAPVAIDVGTGDDVRVSATRIGARELLIETARAVMIVRERAGALVVDGLGVRTGDRRVLIAGRGALDRRGHAIGGYQLPANLADGRVVSGALVLDGAAVMIEIEHRGGRSLVVYDARRGQIRNRVRLGDAAVMATTERRGPVVIGKDRHLALLDLKTGQCTHERIFAAPVAAVAASANGDRYVVIDRTGSILDLTAGLRDVAGGAIDHEVREEHCDEVAEQADEHEADRQEDVAESEQAATPMNELPAPVALEVAPVEVAPVVEAPLLALRPRGRASELSHDERHAFLDDAFELVASWCAIALRREDAAARDREANALVRFQRWDRTVTPLTEMIDDFDLSPLAAMALLVAAAPKIWGELARPYGAIAADAARPLVDEMLVAELLELPRTARLDLARELDDRAPLVRHGLVSIGRGIRPFAAIDVPDVVVRRLTGEAFADAARRDATCALADVRGPTARIAALVADLTPPPTTGEVRVVLRGRAGSGRRTLAAALAARAGRTLGTVALAGPGADSIEQLRRDLRDVHLRGWIACVTDLDHAAVADDASRAALRALLDRHPGPLFVCAGTSSALPLAPGHLSLELPALPVAERVKAWTAALAAVHLPTTDAAALAERYSVGPGAIHHAVAAAALAGTPARTGETIDRVLRQQRAVRLGALASKVEHLASWDDLVLPDELLASVKELVGRVRLRAQVLDGWGMQRVASTGRAVTALLQGGPGTGKTLVAGVIARELGYDLYRVDLSRVTSKWIGETEKNLGELFDAADDGQCILLFDEADSLFGKRTEVKSSNDRHANLEVNYLLQRLDAFEGVAILTTNFGTAIDPAFKRRLSAHLQFPFPDEAERERLWRAHLPASLPVAGDLDLPALARKYALSGGYIRNAALRAAFLAAGERTSLTAEHLRRAVVAEYRDRGKVATTGPLE